MAYTFDGNSRLIILPPGTTTLDVQDMYSRWKEWAVADSGVNLGYAQAMRVVGGDTTIGSNAISNYFYLMNGWKIRPQEANHTLTVTGTLIDEEESDPFANTIGVWRVRIVQIVPLQAETIAVSGSGSGGLTTAQDALLTALAKIHGLVPGVPLVVGPASRVAGDLMQSITEDANGVVTVARA
jgi:hypothetical protein